MMLRSLAVVAALAFGLMAVEANAAPIPITYQVKLYLGGSSYAAGEITTDGAPGSISSSDIMDYVINLPGMTVLTTGNSSLFYDRTSLTENHSILYFSPQVPDDRLIIGSSSTQNLSIRANSASPASTTVQFRTDSGLSGSVDVVGGPVMIGSVAGVPLPPSAPMFGAALVALSVVGYGLKRSGKAAAA